MKTNSTKRGGKAEPAVPTADPTVLIYLHAASKAFPKVESILDKQTGDMTIATLSTMKRTDDLDCQLDTQVRRYRTERQKQTTEEAALLEKALLAEKQIIGEDDRFETEMKDMTQKHKEKCDEIQSEIDRLKVKRMQAKSWEEVKAKRKEELVAQEAKVASLKLQHKAEIKSIMANHEEERRKLRDVLVKKLRTMRDHMTNDDNAGAPSHDGQNGNGNGGSGDIDSPFSLSNHGPLGATSAVKLTERLSREVTTYERETKATTVAINVHEAQLQSLMAQVNASKEANERLVFRNAANAQSFKLLQKKLDEVKGVSQPSGSGAVASGSTTPRSPRNPKPTGSAVTVVYTNKNLSNLCLALSAERQLRSDLESELALAHEEVAAAAKNRKIAEHQLLAQVEKDLNAMEFIESLEVLTKAPQDKPSSFVGSGRIGDSLPPIYNKPSNDSRKDTRDGISHKVNKYFNNVDEVEQSEERTANDWVPEPVYAVGLHKEEDILRFLTVAMNSLLASIPRDFVGSVGAAAKR